MSTPRPQHIPAVRAAAPADPAARFGRSVLDLLADVPGSAEPIADDVEARCRQIADAAARKAGLVAGTLALPPGPWGWLTVMPELIAIWRIQAQMVADIAAARGRHFELDQGQMMFCLFRHTGAQAFRDFAVRAGQRWLLQSATQSMLARAARQVGVRLSKRAIGHGAARWLPLVGAGAVGLYAWYDTRQVARTAIGLFAQPALPPADAA